METSTNKMAKFRHILEEHGVRTEDFDDDFLFIFLRVRKFNINSAIKTLTGFFASKRKIFPTKELSSPLTHIDIFERNIGFAMKRPDKFGRKLILVRFEKWDPLMFTYDEILAATALHFLEIMRCKSTQENGVVILVDLNSFSFRHVQLFGYKRCKLIVELLQGSFPVKVKEMHMINTPGIFSIVYSFLKLFINEKLQQRLKIHGHNIESLHRDVDPDLLPEILGGTLDSEEAMDVDIRLNLVKRNSYYTELLK